MSLFGGHSVAASIILTISSDSPDAVLLAKTDGVHLDRGQRRSLGSFPSDRTAVEKIESRVFPTESSKRLLLEKVQISGIFLVAPTDQLFVRFLLPDVL